MNQTTAPTDSPELVTESPITATQENAAAPAQDTPTPPKRRTNLILGIALLVVGMALGIAGMAYLGQSSQSLPPTDTVGSPLPDEASTPTGTDPLASTTPQPQKNTAGRIVYQISLRQINVYDPATKQVLEVAKTEGGAHGNRLKLPRWVDDNRVIYQECESSDLKRNYKCWLWLHDLKTNQRNAVLERSSVLNPNNYPINGEVSWLGVSPDGQQIAYVANQEFSEASILELKLLNLSTKQERLLDTYNPTPGRGGSLDDYSTIEFSPQGDKVLVNITGLLPAFDKDRGSLFVYDVKSGSNIWSQAGTWTTFAHWVDNNRVVAKFVLGNENHQLAVLSFPNQTQQVTPALNWFNVMPVSANEVVYWTYNPAKGQGVTLYTYNLTTQQSLAVGQNAVLLAKANASTMVVEKLIQCPTTPAGDPNVEQYPCGFDFYNGYMITDKGANLFDIKTGTFTPITITGSLQTSELDIR